MMNGNQPAAGTGNDVRIEAVVQALEPEQGARDHLASLIAESLNTWANINHLYGGETVCKHTASMVALSKLHEALTGKS